MTASHSAGRRAAVALNVVTDAVHATERAIQRNRSPSAGEREANTSTGGTFSLTLSYAEAPNSRKLLRLPHCGPVWWQSLQFSFRSCSPCRASTRFRPAVSLSPPPGHSPQPGGTTDCVDVQPQREGVTLVEQTTRTEDVVRRERKAKRLADKLFFKLDRQGSRYSLRRTAGVSGTVRRENLSLDEVERELEMWKLRGPHGG